MTRFSLAIATLPLLFAVSTDAVADPEEEICEPIKSLKVCPPKSFTVIEVPDGGAPQRLVVNDPFMLYSECSRSKGGLSCSGWPQESNASGRLKYEWSFESAERKLVYPRGDSPTRTVACAPGERIVATLTLSNGNYRASLSQTYDCGGA
jgi:hypothetical protein